MDLKLSRISSNVSTILKDSLKTKLYFCSSSVNDKRKGVFRIEPNCVHPIFKSIKVKTLDSQTGFVPTDYLDVQS